jgi:3-deoxy-7-phosphoheptulonate synthase
MSKIAADIESRRDADLPLVGRASADDQAVVHVGDVAFGSETFAVIAGPCAVESAEQIETAARGVQSRGALVLRGGAFKPRTSPYSFQGLGFEGVELLRRASLKVGIPFITEVMSVDDIDALGPRVDAFQIGTRNMHNFPLLQALGEQSKPVMLKRGFGATLREWLLAAEYVARGGNESIILCERGIRTFGDETRFVQDLAGAVWAKQHSRLPVIVDPSHATGDPALIGPMCRAALAAGVDGVMVEVHPDPSSALSDADQALTFDDFDRIMGELAPIADAVGRSLH